MMKSYLILLCTWTLPLLVKAQNPNTRTDRLYTMSGIGFSFPVGETTDYLKPKFSTSLGLNLALGNGGLFFYPKVSLHAYGFYEQQPDQGYQHTLQKSRATTYLLNAALGYRKITGKFAFYGFAGAGGGIILSPRITVNPTNLTATMDNKSNGMAMIEIGGGTEYNIGGASLFIEMSLMHGFNQMQNRAFNSIPLAVGIKPNLSKLLDQLKSKRN